MKTPAFWYEKKGWKAFALSPLSFVYTMLSTFHFFYRKCFQKRLPIPVICIGNLTLGGSGKTPTAIAIADILKTHYGKTPHFLTRGYGGKVKNLHKTTLLDNPSYTGDEPLLLAKHGTTWVCSDRYQSGKAAHDEGADVCIMDDGLQNPSLFHDLTLLVIDGQQGLGNGCTFPAGPLRTFPKKGMREADAIILIHGSKTDKDALTLYKKPVFDAHFEARLPIPPQAIIAFAGIGYPKKFKHSLETLGFKILAFYDFPDHYVYTEKDIGDLYTRSIALSCPILTTEKDYLKIPAPWREKMYTLPITLSFRDSDSFFHFLEDALKIDRIK